MNVTTLINDIRYALRQLAQQKAFAATALATLALCIGANTAIFSVVNAVLIKPLPFDGAERLVRVHNNYPGAGVERVGASAPDYFDRLEHVPAFEAIAMIATPTATVGEAGRPERVAIAGATPSLFPMLGVDAALGRVFTEDEGVVGNHLVALLTWGYWQERFGGASDVVGRTIRINEVEREIVGVLPRGFRFEDHETRLWIPQTFSEAQQGPNARHSNNWEMIAKLAPGATLEQAQQQLDALNTLNLERFPQFRELLPSVGFHTTVYDYRNDLVRDIEGTLWLLQAGVALILLIGCINIANLVLVRSMSRHRELATRAALGAGRSRLAAQLVIESFVLALAGGALGVLLGWLALGALEHFAVDEMLPMGGAISLDLSTLSAAFVLAAAAAALVAAMPVARLMRTDLVSAIRDAGRAATAGKGTLRGRAALVVVQVTLAFALLVGSGLLLTSYARTLDVPTGFDANGVVTASVALPVTRYPDVDEARVFNERLVSAVEALPGVRAAAVSTMVPFTGGFTSNALYAEGQEVRTGEPLLSPASANVTPAYFEAMGIPVIAGRAFTGQDDAQGMLVAIVDRGLAQRLWRGEDPIGRRLSFGAPGLGETQWRTVVGVVDDVRLFDMTGDQPPGHVYVPYAQMPFNQTHLVVRGAIAPDALIAPLRAVVAELDPELPLHNPLPLTERVARSLQTERVRMVLVLAFGAVALMLAAVGLYGVLSYTVAERRAEIGIRMALGSTGGQVFVQVLRQGVVLTAIGFTLGVAVSVVVGALLSQMLYGVSAVEAGVLVAVFGILAVAAFAACAIPAARAMHTAPVIAMRGDA